MVYRAEHKSSATFAWFATDPIHCGRARHRGCVEPGSRPSDHAYISLGYVKVVWPTITRRCVCSGDVRFATDFPDFSGKRKPADKSGRAGQVETRLKLGRVETRKVMV